MRTNAYRCLEPCNNCPFMDDGEKIHLREGRVDSIKEELDAGETFACHKTVYDLDENMEHTDPQERKMCFGAYKYLKDTNNPNQMMQIAERLGLEKEEETI